MPKRGLAVVPRQAAGQGVRDPRRNPAADRPRRRQRAGVWADKGYQGAGGTVTVPYRGRWKNLSGKRAVNSPHTQIRAVGEQANAALKTWRLLRKLRCSPSRTTPLVQAVLTLHLGSV